MRIVSTRLVLWLALASVGVVAGTAAAGASAATPAKATLLRLDGIGPLRLGMTREAALATGWLAQRRTGCPLGGPPLPITYRLSGPKAPARIRGIAEFVSGRLRAVSVTAGARTAAGAVVGSTTAKEMAALYRAAGFAASARYDSTFVGTFVVVRRNGKIVIGGFAEAGRVRVIGIPYVPVCE